MAAAIKSCALIVSLTVCTTLFVSDVNIHTLVAKVAIHSGSVSYLQGLHVCTCCI